MNKKNTRHLVDISETRLAYFEKLLKQKRLLKLQKQQQMRQILKQRQMRQSITPLIQV